MDNNRNPKNLLWLSPALVLLVIGLCVALSMVPDRYWMRDARGNPLKVFGQALKKPDMMSMFHETEGTGGDASEPDSTGDYLASMRRRPDAHEGNGGEGAAGRGGDDRADSLDPYGPEAYVPGQAGDSSAAAAAARAAADTNFHSIAIEDFTPQHIALSRFYSKLEKAREGNLGRPLHIAFLGDSFIEGDILVADLRSGLQREYGGGGVGFVPVATEVDQYRATVRMKSGGWKSYSILYDKHQAYTLPGMVFEASVPNPTIEVSATRSYPNIFKHATVGVISEGKSQYDIYFSTKDTSYVRHVDAGGGSAADSVGVQRMADIPLEADSLGDFSLKFSNALGLKVLGLTIERRGGVSVDNFSLRGNSGTVLQRLNAAECAELNSVRPYDLIILEYGLNVASDSTRTYGWYSVEMQRAVSRLRQNFPDADFLILGVSDRAHNTDAGLETMPAVLSLLSAQRDCARKSGSAFWNVYAAMGGHNSMVQWVKWNWAAQDYTHIGFRGGKKLAEKLLEALDYEKKNYYGEE